MCQNVPENELSSFSSSSRIGLRASKQIFERPFVRCLALDSSRHGSSGFVLNESASSKPWKATGS
jgi:hypothetical protein